MTRSKCLAELETVKYELAAIGGESWNEFYDRVASDVEAHAVVQQQ